MELIGKLVLCCFIVATSISSSSAIVRRSCEGGTLPLSCPHGTAIRINKANYGRTAGKGICPHRNIRTTSCFASSSFSIVNNNCDGRTSCSVSAKNGVFGDPCHGTYKYLQVDYSCEPEASLFGGRFLRRSCEGRTLSLSCPHGTAIRINNANYGRTAGKGICPHKNIRTTSCFASSSFSIVNNNCDGRTSCSVSAKNGVFGDPCRGTYKYLEVDYSCEPEASSKVERTCEGGFIELHCPEETLAIHIRKALYGRRLPGSALCSHLQIGTTNCAASSSMHAVQSACQGRASCSVAASNNIFGDPCIGTYKYLEIEYTCARRGRRCEGGSLTLSCPSGQILVLDAFYGRMAGPEICPHSQVSHQHCRASSSLPIVKGICNGQTSCSVSATNNVFGDPCVGTYKYLEVLYECA